MELSPFLYHKLVRPRWATEQYIDKIINDNFNLVDKNVLEYLECIKNV
jgi:hypothetical protein